MSRHYFDCKRRGAKVRVILGYDRPLDEFLMLVEKLTVRGHSALNPLYAAIADPDNEPDLDYYRQKLEALGIEAPASLFDAVEQDAIDRRGNYIVEHFVDGTSRVLYDEGGTERQREPRDWS